jgi:hypothetical protein
VQGWQHEDASVAVGGELGVAEDRGLERNRRDTQFSCQFLQRCTVSKLGRADDAQVPAENIVLYCRECTNEPVEAFLRVHATE